MKNIFKTSFLMLLLFFTSCWRPNLNKITYDGMFPTLKTGDYYIFKKYFNLEKSEFDYGDVISFHAAKEKKNVARIIAKPNDLIEIENDQIKVNGKLLERFFIKNESNFDYYYKFNNGFKYIVVFNKLIVSTNEPNGKGNNSIKVQLNSNEYFLVGDNRSNSYDSRSYGAIKFENFIGKAKKIVKEKL